MALSNYTEEQFRLDLARSALRPVKTVSLTDIIREIKPDMDRAKMFDNEPDFEIRFG